MQINNLQNAIISASGVNNGRAEINTQNNYFTFIDKSSNEIEIIIDCEQLKEDYLTYYQIFEEKLDGIFDDLEKRAATQLLCQLIDVKAKINSSTVIIVYTQDYLKLMDKLNNTNDLYLKINLSKNIETEKVKCKELTLFFDLIFRNIIELDSLLIMTTINTLLTTDSCYAWGDEQEISKFYESFVTKEEIGFSINELRDYISAFLFENISENIFVPSYCTFVHKTYNNFGVIIKYPMDRKTGELNAKEKKEVYLEAQFYSEIIKNVIEQNINQNDNMYFHIENYSAKLHFTSREKEIRFIIAKYIFDGKGIVLKKFEKDFKYGLLTKNPILPLMNIS